MGEEKNMLLYILLAAALALIPAAIAKNKGKSFLAFYIFGFFLWLPALIVAAVMSSEQRVEYVYMPIPSSKPPVPAKNNEASPSQENKETKQCPRCGATVNAKARICVFCQQDLF